MLWGVWETGKANGAIFHLILYQIEAFQRKENPVFSVSWVLFLKATWLGGQSAGLTIDKQYMIEIYDQFFGNLTELYELCSDESNSPTAIKPNTFVLRSKNSLLPYHSRPYRQIKTKIFKSSFQGHTNMIFL